MFDVGFSELVLIFVIALIVLGPERLPKVARTAGRWIGRARRMARSLQYELERELDVNAIAGEDAQHDAAGTSDNVTPHPKYGQAPVRAAEAPDKHGDASPDAGQGATPADSATAASSDDGQHADVHGEDHSDIGDHLDHTDFGHHTGARSGPAAQIRSAAADLADQDGEPVSAAHADRRGG